ncbi:MAG: ABC transporter substrate-binding protein [Gammaproteobacteria bacterium]|nr:ABC transporter substrate-binding protein [Gammaproteobacteria bacterium]
MQLSRFFIIAAGILSVMLNAAAAEADKADAIVSHALAMHGKVKYPDGFTHFDYTNPNAPKGGEVRLAGIGTFDNLNPFILKGVAPSGTGRMFDTLTVKSHDEAFSQYGLIAETMEMPKDRSWIIYTLRKEAKFHDGSPITPEDVVFSMNILKEKGHPLYRTYYQNVEKVEKTGERRVKFSFTKGTENRELPLIVGQLQILSKAYWDGRKFDKTTQEPPLGSGPYRIEAFEAGRYITYRRVEDYWGARLPVNAGQNNIDLIRYDYYRDRTVALQALKAGEYDFRQENVAKNWATAYDIPPVRNGWLVKKEISHEIPTGMQCLVYNTRRPVFQNSRVREALAYAFDFEWTNKNLFNSAYTRTVSFFSNSELASSGLPDPLELAVLEKFRGRIPSAVFDKEYKPPVTDGSGNIRKNLRKAVHLLAQAGWKINKKRQLANTRTGQAMTFEILLISPAFERVILPFKKNLQRLGIEAKVRTVDPTQYQNRMREFKFDMLVHVFSQSLSPGNEQRDFWNSKLVDISGSRNLAGIRDPVVDELIELVISAPDRKSLITRTRALDRVLLFGHYVIPQWHSRIFRLAYWNKFARPEISPKYDLGFDTWWIDPEKAAALKKYRGKSSF